MYDDTMAALAVVSAIRVPCVTQFRYEQGHREHAMTAEIEKNAADTLVDMAKAFLRGKALCAAVRLGIADALESGEKSLEELAAETESDSSSLNRLLRALTSLGVVKEATPGRFALTSFGDPLRRSAPNSIWASVVFWGDLLADFWTYLPECVRNGGNTDAFGVMESLGIKSRWSMEPDAQAIFHKVFAEPTAADMAPIVEAYDFSRCGVVADLGGAGGGLISAILTANPQTRGILVDRQEAVDRASARLERAGLIERCRLVAGDLLLAVPSGADVYILKNVLHGYDDCSALRVLQHCQAAMQSGTRLLVIETVVPVRIDSSDPRVEEMLMSDLNMLAVTGGRERNATEWTELLARAGIELQRIATVDDSSICIIEAVSSESSIKTGSNVRDA